MIDQGFVNVYALKGGLRAWQQAGYPTQEKVASQKVCIECHKAVTPRIVRDWELSEHSRKINDVSCSVCHGDSHMGPDDVHKVEAVTPRTCQTCHEKQWQQFKRGKHSKAWAAMQAMPTMHWQPMALTSGMKGCGGCHKIGFKTQEEIADLKKEGGGFGLASCDTCHTRHTFSVQEARQPQACRTCHAGFDHPQWEMYEGSKHGTRNELKQLGVLDDNAAAPTCQSCHMADGDHEVRTAWGFLGLRLPLPEDDTEWAQARTSIFQALGILNQQGEQTDRFEVFADLDFLRQTEEDWDRERQEMLKVCGDCHSQNFAQAELSKGDQMIRQTDLLMAQGIELVADLYAQGVLQQPSGYAQAFPDILAFHDAPSTIEQKLFLMFQEYRMRSFQGVFHANPDYALWYGWSKMRQTLTEMREMAKNMAE